MRLSAIILVLDKAWRHFLKIATETFVKTYLSPYLRFSLRQIDKISYKI